LENKRRLESIDFRNILEREHDGLGIARNCCCPWALIHTMEYKFQKLLKTTHIKRKYLEMFESAIN
jgi:hypothetical protein